MKRVAKGWLAVPLLALSGCALFSPDASVEVRVDGVEERGVRRELERGAEVGAPLAGGVPSALWLQRLADTDAREMEELLHSRGWFRATVVPEWATNRSPPRVTFRVDSGERFAVREVSILCEDVVARDIVEVAVRRRELLPPGSIYDGRAAMDAADVLGRRLREAGYPWASVVVAEVRVDPAARAADIVFRATPGSRAVFGEARVRGLRSLDPRFVHNDVTWRQGEVYDERVVDQARERLRKRNLFSFVSIVPLVDETNTVVASMDVELRERRRNSFALAAGYTSDKGYEYEASGTRRNLFGSGESIRLTGRATEVGWAADVLYDMPQFLRADQDLVLDLQRAVDDLDAYESRKTRLSARVRRQITDRWTGLAGGALQSSQVDQGENDDSFILASVPLGLRYDTTREALDPTRGVRLGLDSEPFYNVEQLDEAFWKNAVSASHYIRGSVADRPMVLALRATLGVTGGASRGNVPADERFYAGGGGSIRGYAYQSVGPLVEGNPVGGLSVFETSAEVRVRVTPGIGVVVFADGGSAYADAVPDSEEPLRWGAGAGLRFFTPIGPLRLDVAAPLDRREGIDRSFQTYISIGQAF